MGKQTSFYLTPGDTTRLESILRSCGPMEVIHSRAPSSSPRAFPTLQVQEHGQDWLFLFLARKEDVPHILMKEVPAQNYWAIDSLRSPVVEFTRSFFDGARLRAGRVHYDEGFYDAAGLWVKKPESFLEWAECVFRILKRNLKKAGNYYVGEDAARLKAEDAVELLK